MGKNIRSRLPRMCRPAARVRIGSLSNVRSTKSFKTDRETEHIGRGSSSSREWEEKKENRIMVNVDESVEAKGALEWALTHAVQTQDTLLLLLLVRNPSRQVTSGKHDLRIYEFLDNIKKMCQVKRPGVQVEFVLVEGKEKGPTIVEEAKKQRVQLLVVGKRKRPVWSQLLIRWFGRAKGIVEYCIQNAHCMTIAVRKKGTKFGGYVITTKRHKNFWLLA